MQNTRENNAAHYVAFISYAHENEAIAARLHRALETYRVPKNLRHSSRPLKPIFRDVAELSAAHSLSEKIQDAVRRSRFLIVLCSPAAKESHWVNEEIKLFRAEHGDAAILCALIEGTPQTAFPPALTEGGREPLAANLPDNKTAFRLGVTQLAATMLGTELDTLIQRDAKRRVRKFQTATVASLALTGIMGMMTFAAVDARQEADKRADDAEGWIEFALTDLKDKLEPIGKLDALEVVGTKASDYYDSYDLSDHDDDALGRRARVYHYLGEIKYSQGQTKEAINYFDQAYQATGSLLARAPNNPDRIFDHAQSAFWRATPMYRAAEFDEARPYIQDYIDLAEQLNIIEPDTVRGLQEPGFAYQNMAVLHHRQGNYDLAEPLFQKAYEVKAELGNRYPENVNYQLGIAKSLEAMAGIKRARNDLVTARDIRDKELNIYLSLLAKEPGNRKIQYEMYKVYIGIAHIESLLKSSDKALKFYEKANATISKLHELDPENTSWTQSYLEAYRQLVTFLIGQGKFDLANSKLQKARPILELYADSLDEEIPSYNYQKEQQTFLQTAIDIISGRFAKALVDVEKFYSENYSNSENLESMLRSGMHNYILCLKSILNHDSERLNSAIKEYQSLGLDTDSAWRTRYVRAQASREFVEGEKSAIDKYIEVEKFQISKQVFTALRDGEY